MSANLARIIHLSDIHIRDSARDKFAASLRSLSQRLGDLPLDSVPTIAVIAGDVFNSRTRLSAENITDYYALLDCLATRASAIIIIPGRADDARVDLLAPLIANCRALPRGCVAHYWSRSDWYALPAIPEIAFYVFAPGVPGALGAPPSRAPIRIALLHDTITDLRVAGGEPARAGTGISRVLLESFDAVICGHVHDYFSAPPIVYCGAFTQLTIGETFDKGVVIWTIPRAGARPTHCFARFENVPGAMIKYVISRNPTRITYNRTGTGPGNDAMPRDTARVVLELRSDVTHESQEVTALLARVARECPDARVEVISPADSLAVGVSRALAGGANLEAITSAHREIITRKVRESTPGVDDATIASVIALHADALRRACATSSMPIVSKWRPLYLGWSNLFCYGADNYINFATIAGIAGLVAPNRCGKSSIIDILVLALYNETLRGSAYNIIKRGAREGSLICVWEANGARHEISRKWDVKGHTTMRYSIGGVDRACADLRATYAEIARTVGTLEDFLAAALVPQHDTSSSSFLDITDARRRAILSRILGLDILDGALEVVRERERDTLTEVRALESQTGAALARMRNAQGTRVAQCAAPDDTARDPVAEKYRELIERARVTTAAAREELEKLESLPAVVKPVKSSRELTTAIRALSATVAQLDGDIAARECALEEKRAQLANIPQYTQPINAAMIDAARARIDVNMITLGRARGAELDAIEANVARATERLRALHEARRIREELEALGPATTGPVSAPSPEVLASKLTLEEIAAELARIPAPSSLSCPASCACGNSPARAAEFRARIGILECALFAPGVAIPAAIPATLDAVIARATECCAALARATGDAISTDAQRAHAIELANCAIRAVRLMGGDAGSRAQRESELAQARACIAQHDEIMRARAWRARIAFLQECRDVVRAARATQLRASLDALGLSGTSARDLASAIFECERALAAMVDLREKVPRIRAALAQDEEVRAMQARLDARNTTVREALIVERLTNEIAPLRARRDIANVQLTELRAQLADVSAVEEAFAAFTKRNEELVAMRSTYAHAQTTLINITAEAKEYDATRAEWRLVGDKQRALHERARICAIYRSALDARTGVQHSMMLGAIGLIEGEVNRILESIAGLRINLGITGVTGAMHITVHDVIRDVIHPADLCSGFQRFIINIAMRRAFLCAAIRPMPRFIIIDEGFGCIDDANMARVCEYLPELARELDFMIVASHSDALNALIAVPLGIVSARVAGADGWESSLRFGDCVTPTIPKSASASATKPVRAKAAAAAPVEEPNPAIADKCADGTYFCKACAKGFKVWLRHKKSAKHIARCTGVFAV